VPRWHDSEVSAIAYAIQNIIANHSGSINAVNATALENHDMPVSSLTMLKGKKCPECGAHAVIRKDGCDYCTQCGFMGVCG
jgi:ribonucleoside-diphosphate reductase alpha chain